MCTRPDRDLRRARRSNESHDGTPRVRRGGRRVTNVEVDGTFDAEKVAHESGHVFGLGGPEAHVDDPENVMHPVPGRELTDDQRDTVIAHAHRFGACAEG